MKARKSLLGAVFAIAVPMVAQAEVTVVPGNVTAIIIDGDTISLRGERIRILSIDTPETFQPRCENELVLGLKAKERLRQLLPKGLPISVDRHGRDRYGRTLANLFVDDYDVGAVLFEEGYALRYEPGREARLRRLNAWCGAVRSPM